MFDLKKSIAGWRKQMLAAGIHSPEALDELESHLREEIQQQQRSGLSGWPAFETAVQKIGEAGALKCEFKKICGVSKALEKLMIGIGFIFIGFIIFLSAATVYLCFAGLGERLIAATAMACTVLVACGWRYAVPFLPVIPNKGKRLAVGLICIASGFGISAFFCSVILPHFENKSDHQIPAIGFWAAFIIAVFSCAGVGLTLSEHERKIRGMNKSWFKSSTAADW